MCYRFTAGGVRLAAKVMRSVVSVRPTVCFLSILSLHVMFKIRTEGNIFVRLFALGWIGLNQLTSVLDFFVCNNKKIISIQPFQSRQLTEKCHKRAQRT